MIDAQRAREIIAAGKRRTISQRLGQTAIHVRTMRRLQVARDMSTRGASFAEAAKAAGLKECGLKALLVRKYGTASWPIATTTTTRTTP